MGKVKVSKELALAVDKVIEFFSGNKEKVLESHSGNWCDENHLPLNSLSKYQLAEILIKGYEIEQTKEEQALHTFQVCRNIVCTTHNIRDEEWSKGYMQGMRFMNDLYGLNINFDNK